MSKNITAEEYFNRDTSPLEMQDLKIFAKIKCQEMIDNFKKALAKEHVVIPSEIDLENEGIPFRIPKDLL